MGYYITPEDYEIAAKNGINVNNVNNRVYWLGWSIQRAITEKIHDNNKGYKELAKAHNINYNTFITRLNKGFTIEEALNKEIMSVDDKIKLMTQKRKRVFTDEQLQIAEQNDIPASALYWRVSKGFWSVEKAISTPLQRR